MKLLDKEEIIWESKNKRLLLTSHRLREEYKSPFASNIRSIMLEELKSCELRTIRQFRFLRHAILLFLFMNGGVFLLNHYLFKSTLIEWLFDEVQIGPETVKFIFGLSIAMAIGYLILFIFSVKKVFTFYATGMVIDFQLRWLDHEERESFISMVEEAKDRRRKLV